MVICTRLFWTPLHLLWSILVVGVMVVFRRGGALVFTHYQDIDADGRDQQMGPLVDSLIDDGERLVEICRVPLGPGLLHGFRFKRRLFVSQAILLAPAWLLSAGSVQRAERLRRFTAWCLLWLVRPKILYLIDESGSGQALLQAARMLGIRVVGIQHGDFAQSSQYCLSDVSDREPADVLCVWSSWYRDRLLKSSPIYTNSNVRVTGRLRYSDEACTDSQDSRQGRMLRVLVIGEHSEGFWDAMDPFVQALVGCEGFDVDVRRHPADMGSGALPTSMSLTTALQDSDIVIGNGSSALLEAIYWYRPVIVCAVGELGDRAGYVRDGLAVACDNPVDLAEICQRVFASDRHGEIQTAHDMVWGRTQVEAAPEILAAGAASGSSEGPSEAEVI